MRAIASRVYRLLGLALMSTGLSVGCAQLLGLKEDVPAAPCVLNSDCNPNELCIFRVCSAACKLDKDCLPGSRCLDTGGSAACVVAQGATCSAGADGGDAACPDGSVCDAAQTCRNSCVNCHSDQTCIDDVCVGTDASHDPGATGAGGTDGAGGSTSTGGANSSGGHGGRAATGGSGGAGGKGSATGGNSTIGDAGATSVVSCGDTVVGAAVPCSEKPDGTPISFPGGVPQGPCAAGSKTCASDGTFGSCVGAVAPGQTDCTSTLDKNCDGMPDNTQCGLCTAGATQYCYDAPADTAGVGACKAGTQVCQLDATKTATVWGPCAGEITPAPNDTCDTGNDATCNKVANEGCTCLNGQSASCGSALQSLGNCAAGTTKCAGGNWGVCSVAPKAGDTCDPGDDGNCNGTANQGCACTNGQTMPCGASGMGCTLGNQTCQGGAWSGCAGNVCADFSVPPPTAKCTSSGTTSDDIDASCTIAVCDPGYYVSDCVMKALTTKALCTFNGPDFTTPRIADVTTTKLTGAASASCGFTSCTCHLEGF